MNEFVTAILEDRKPMIDIVMALNLSVAGVVCPPIGAEGGRNAQDPPVPRRVAGAFPRCRSKVFRTRCVRKNGAIRASPDAIPETAIDSLILKPRENTP